MNRFVSLALMLFCGLLSTQGYAQVAVAPGEAFGGLLDLGDEVLVSLEDLADLRLVSRASTFPVDGNRGFLIGVPSTLAPGRYELRVRLRDASWTAPVDVVAREYARQRIVLGEGLTDLVLRDDPRKAAEARELAGLLARVDGAATHHRGAFNMPVEERNRSSGFGVIREYVYADGSAAESVHRGVDLAVPAGTPVVACGAGRVVMAVARVISGNTVVVEHLPGVYSVYYHLAETTVREGELVAGGQRIGSVGATGLATGPHLHWEFRISGVAVNPETIVIQVDTTRLTPVMYGGSPPEERR